MISAKEARRSANIANRKPDPIEVLNAFISSKADSGLYECLYDERRSGKLYGDKDDIVEMLEEQGYRVTVDEYFDKGIDTHGFDVYLNVYHIEW